MRRGSLEDLKRSVWRLATFRDRNSRPAQRSRRLVHELLEDRRLLSIGGLPVSLPGMHLVDPSVDRFEGQIVYLDFDGAEDVTYNGPIAVEGIDIPPFSAVSLGLAGHEGELARTTTEYVAGILAPLGVGVTSELPDTSEYSTVYVGGMGDAFSSYGDFNGLAEAVDVGNINRMDKAFVFSEAVVIPPSSADQYCWTIAGIVAHEAAHLLGFQHTGLGIWAGGLSDDRGLPYHLLADVAHACDVADGKYVHQWIAEQAAVFYASQFPGSELSSLTYRGFISASADDGHNPYDIIPPDPWTGNDLLEGTYEEDTLTVFNAHFAAGGDGSELDAGLSGWIPTAPFIDLVTYDSTDGRYYSAYERAQNIWDDRINVNAFANSPGSTIYYLGRVAHLLADMTVPAHTHNDVHFPWPNVDAYETTIASSFNSRLWGYRGSEIRGGPIGDIPLYGSLRDLFRTTADYTEEYDSGPAPSSFNNGIDDLGYDGDDENGVPNDGGYLDVDLLSPRHIPHLVDRHDGFSGYNDALDISSRNDITRLGDDLMPFAMEQTAALFRLFYSDVDTTDPQIELIGFNHYDENDPQIIPTSSFRFRVGASDQATCDSGVGESEFTLLYQEKAPGGSWSVWHDWGAQDLHPTYFSDGGFLSSSLAGKDGVLVQPVFAGQPGYTYRFRAFAKDGAGRQGRTAQCYVQIDPSAEQGISVVEVIDRSGSMTGSKIAAAKNAASLFVGLMNPGDKIGIASYSSSATVDYTLTEITPGSNVQDEARDAIDALVAGGRTSIGAGVQAADSELDQFPNDPIRAMIVMTDGQENVTPWAIDVINSYVDNDIKILTIGFGTDADEGLLTNMANLRNGQYWRASEVNLNEVYAEIYGAAGGGEQIHNSSAAIQPSEQTSRNVNVDPSATRLTVGVNWSGSDLDLELVTPDGTVITHDTPSTDPHVELIEGATYEFYKIDAPLCGQWEMHIITVDIPPEGEEYNLYAVVDSAVTVEVSTDRASYQVGELVDIQVTLDDGAPIADASAVAYVTPPGSATYDTARVVMYDDGNHNDGIANDGVYANVFRRACRQGEYAIDLEIIGQSQAGFEFTRAPSLSVVVTSAEDTDGDGMPDNWEDREGTDKTVDDASGDLDNDTLSNVDEFYLGTTPVVDDTDGDQYFDGVEVIAGTDPVDPDNTPFPLNATDDVASSIENTPVTIDVLANDSGPGGAPLSVVAVTQGSAGSVVNNHDGTVTYTPDAAFRGADSFEYTIINGQGGIGDAAVTVSVGTLPIHENFDDGAADDFESQTGLWSVIPDPNPRQPGDLVYQATAPAGGNAVSTLAMQEALPEDLDIRVTFNSDDKSTSRWSNAFAIFDYLSPTDFKFAGAFVGINKWVIGHAANNANGYVADKWVSGQIAPLKDYPIQVLVEGRSVTLKVYQGNGYVTKATHTFGDLLDGDVGLGTLKAITRFDDFSAIELKPPVATNDTATTDEDTQARIEVLTNDSDPNGEALRLTAVTKGDYGTVADNGDGTLSYLPDADFHGNDSFTYTISNISGRTATATVSVTVGPVPDDPVAVNDQASTDENTPVNVPVLDNDYDPDGTACSLGTASDGNHGTSQANPDGTVTYTPNDGYKGPDSFSYTIADGNSGAGSGTVTVTVGGLSIEEDFNDGTADDFSPQAGKWSITGNKYLAEQETRIQNVVSLLQITDPLPSSLEFAVTFSSDPITSSRWSNAFIVFDYKSPTDYKFAGAFVGIDYWTIGRMTPRGYVMDKSIREQIDSDTDYELRLLLEGSTATLKVGGVTKVSHTYDDSFQDGELGLATLRGNARFDGLSVREL